MSLRESRENVNHREQVCPFLGLKDDPDTALSFPSSHNRCFHARPVIPVELEFQRKYCLTINYTSCGEYNRKLGTSLSPDLSLQRGNGVRGIFGKVRVWLLFLLFIAVFLSGWQALSRGLLGLGTPKQSLSVTKPLLLTGVSDQTPAISPSDMPDTPTPTLLMRATSTPTLLIQTFAPTVVSFHALETPIGVDHKLVIHQVLAGESIESIANQYWTTAEAIQAVNYNLPSPLQVDWLIIVPANLTDVTGLPVFEAYEVKTEIAVRTLAQLLSVDPAIFELYNGLGNNEFLSSGEWVLVPHMNTATP